MLESLLESDLKASNFIKKKLQHRCFPVNMAKFLRTAFLWNTSGGCFWFHHRNINITCVFINISKFNNEKTSQKMENGSCINLGKTFFHI